MHSLTHLTKEKKYGMMNSLSLLHPYIPLQRWMPTNHAQPHLGTTDNTTPKNSGFRKPSDTGISSWSEHPPLLFLHEGSGPLLLRLFGRSWLQFPAGLRSAHVAVSARPVYCSPKVVGLSDSPHPWHPWHFRSEPASSWHLRGVALICAKHPQYYSGQKLKSIFNLNFAG